MAEIGKKPEFDLASRLRRLRAAGRAAILFERVWPAIWPALGIGGVFLCIALLDLPARLPPWLHIALLVAFAVAFLLGLARGISRIAMPTGPDADRRLERRSGLLHRPLAALTDRPSGDDPTAAAIWREHLARSVGQVRRLRVGLPRAGLARRDPRGAARGTAGGAGRLPDRRRRRRRDACRAILDAILAARTGGPRGRDHRLGIAARLYEVAAVLPQAGRQRDPRTDRIASDGQRDRRRHCPCIVARRRWDAARQPGCDQLPG